MSKQADRQRRLASRQVSGHRRSIGRMQTGTARQIGGEAPIETGPREAPAVAAPPSGPATDRCDSCGKQVRVRKDGALYAHRCSS